MLEIKKIEFGLISTGAAIGNRAIFLEFEETEKHPKKSLFERLYNSILNSPIENYFIQAINGSHSVFLVFKSGPNDKIENFTEFNQFNIELSKKSIEIQKELKLAQHQMKPPFCIWVGNPKVFSAKNNYYQLFNCLYPIITINSNEPEYTQLALQECINHQFSTVLLNIIEFDEQKIKDLVNKFLLKFNKVALIGSIENKKLTDYCLNRGYRFYPNFEGVNFISCIPKMPTL